MSRTEIREGISVRGFQDDVRAGVLAGVSLFLGSGGSRSAFIIQDLSIAEARALAKALEDAATFAEQAVSA